MVRNIIRSEYVKEVRNTAVSFVRLIVIDNRFALDQKCPILLWRYWNRKLELTRDSYTYLIYCKLFSVSKKNLANQSYPQTLQENWNSIGKQGDYSSPPKVISYVARHEIDSVELVTVLYFTFGSCMSIFSMKNKCSKNYNRPLTSENASWRI